MLKSRGLFTAIFGVSVMVVVGLTIIGSLFIPFLAAALLYLNNRAAWPGPIRRNNIATNAVLVRVAAVRASGRDGIYRVVRRT